jgi:hypothetical protein
MLWAWVPDAFVTSRIGDMREPLLAFRNRDGRNDEEPNRARQVSPLDGRLRLFLDTAGPTLSAFGAFGVRGFEMQNDMKLSPFELPNAETPTRLDLAPRVLWMDDLPSSPAYPMGAIQCANLGAPPLAAISRQPSICSLG